MSTTTVEVSTACRSCGYGELRPLLSLGDQPLANALLVSDEASSEVRAPLDLEFCPQCALVQITASVHPDVLFADEYTYFTSYSPTLVENAEDLVERLISERDLGPSNLAMEIASNDGYLLQHYVRAGVQALGIDPASNVVPDAQRRGVETIQDFFGPELAARLRDEGLAADVIHANNVMAHVPDPNGVVEGLRISLAPDGIVSIETPYVGDLIGNLEFDTVYHEHLFYYSLTSLSALLERNGLGVAHVERIPIHGGSLRVFAGHAACVVPTAATKRLLEDERRAGMDRYAFYEDFASRVEDLRSNLRGLLIDLRRQGRRVAGYGAAAKATVLMNALGVGPETIEFVADRSPHKQGRYIPGALVPIVPTARLVEDRPDDVVLFAWNFADEILAQQQEFRDAGGRFIIPLPVPRMV